MASGKGDIYANELFLHALENANIALIGDNTGLLAAGTVGSVWISLHTSVTGLSAGNQETNECDYVDYERIAVARTDAKWTTAAKATANTDAITFIEAGVGTTLQTATHFVVGTDETGAGKILYWGEITTPSGGLSIDDGIVPAFAPGTLALTEA